MKPPETHRSRLEIPPEELYLHPTLDFISAFAANLGMHADRLQHLRKASQIAIETVIRSNQNGGEGHSIGAEAQKVVVDTFEAQGRVYVEVLNRGVPIFLDPMTNPELDQGFYASAHHLDKLSIENLGRLGQTVVMAMGLGSEAAKRVLDLTGTEPTSPVSVSEEIVLRAMRPDEGAALSQLFYSVYGYNYINEFIYYPEKIAAMVEEGRLISIVGALPDGKLVGHVGLVKWGDDPPVYEPALGVVDPRVKSRGLFSSIFQRLMERVNEISMQYCFFDFVTNHDFSQRFVAKYNPCDLAIFVGCQSSATQAKLERLGLGPDSKEMDRYSLLYSVIPRVSFPFGREAQLAEQLGGDARVSPEAPKPELGTDLSLPGAGLRRRLPNALPTVSECSGFRPLRAGPAECRAHYIGMDAADAQRVSICRSGGSRSRPGPWESL